MDTAEALWSADIRSRTQSASPEMHDYFAFLRQNGWFDDVVDMVLDQVMDYLTEDWDTAYASRAEVKHELVHANPEGVANTVFRFILDDTLEKLGHENAGPVHWATAAYFWFKWKDAHVARMIEVRDHLPEYIPA